jgi:hypothetical protein
VWATWHLPFWLLQSTFDQYGPGYLALSFIFVLTGNFYITWFFNRSQSSLLLAVVYHVAFNIVNVALLPVTSTQGAFIWFLAVEVVIAMLVAGRLAPRPAAR